MLSLLVAYLTWLPVHLATEAHCHVVTHDQKSEHSHGGSHHSDHRHHHGEGHSHDSVPKNNQDPGHSHHTTDAHQLDALKSDTLDTDLLSAELTPTTLMQVRHHVFLVRCSESHSLAGAPTSGPPSSRAPPCA